MKIKQSICIPMMKPADLPLDQFIPAVAKIGYAAVELWGMGGDFDEVVGLCAEHKLTLATACGHGTLSEGLNDTSQHERIEAELRKSIEVAARCGIPGLICFSGNKREGVDESVAMVNTVNILRRIAPHAEKQGVNLNMELLNSKVDHAGYQCDGMKWGVAVCERVGSPRVKLLYDVYHMQIMEGDVIRTVQKNIKWIGHFHTAGVPGRSDFDDSQELNYTGICAGIAATDYPYYVGHEFKPKGDVISAMEKAFRICDQG